MRATPVSFHTVRPAAQRASLQVVAADKMTRPNLDHPDLEQFKTGPNDTGSSSFRSRSSPSASSPSPITLW